MTPTQLYRSSYPRTGDAALLCEGDLLGFEVAVLQRWLPTAVVGGEAVDIWPCGTKDAVRGMLDSIGRARPVAGIVDRDWISYPTVRAKLESEAKGLQARAVQVAFYGAWERPEIENYLLDECVLLPVLTSQFGVSEDQVRRVFQDLGDSEVARAQVDQLLQWIRSVGGDVARSYEGWLRGDEQLGPWCKPKWEAGGWQRGGREAIQDCVDRALERLPEWSEQKLKDRPLTPDRISRTWHDWQAGERGVQDVPGKELLQCVCAEVAFGAQWRANSLGAAEPGSPEYVRTLLRLLQPALAAQLVKTLAEHEHAASDEWWALADTCAKMVIPHAGL
ncbi:MAG: hypothetical protein IT204_07505 [Fimbriimonadaceae bacterium]|nr:hypothetical protein [Fimbriimonadaceae bacterium]